MSNRLTDAYARTASRPGRHTFPNENGLCLVVAPTLRKRWIQRITIGGRSTDLGLGGYPLVSLSEARENARVNRRLARSGKDPRTEHQDTPSFAEAATKMIELNRPTWSNTKHAAQWTATLGTYAFPHFGRSPVDEISSADVIKALTPIWTSKPETARRVRQRISAVMKWSIANNFRPDDPAGEALKQVLPRTPLVRAHFKALHYSEAEDALKAVRESSALAISKLSLEFLVLTAARSGEVRNAEWTEIDFGAKTWIVPAVRMKGRREHRVPLSGRAMEILTQAQVLDSGSGLVFPSRNGRPLSDMTHVKLLKRLGIDCVPHGFRSSFRDWAAEQTDASHAVMEAALAHVVKDSTEAAYFRSDLFERRRVLMAQWSEYLSASR